MYMADPVVAEAYFDTFLSIMSYGSTRDGSEVYSSSEEGFAGFDEDEIDFSAWNPESLPLLKRTIDQARSLGAKRTLSWVAGTVFF